LGGKRKRRDGTPLTRLFFGREGDHPRGRAKRKKRGEKREILCREKGLTRRGEHGKKRVGVGDKQIPEGSEMP